MVEPKLEPKLEPCDLVGRELAAVVRALTTTFRQHGIGTPNTDARLLIAHALAMTAERLLMDAHVVLDEAAAHRLAKLANRRLGREPVSRILGSRGFYGREFSLSPNTLDPRPDSECMIETVLRLVADAGVRNQPLSIVDIGTGSGCLLLTLLAELPHAWGLGTDVSEAALGVALSNAHRLDLTDRCSFEVRRSLEGVPGPFDILVSNPPYIKTSELAALEPEVRRFDPYLSLDGGPDGLAIYRQIIDRLPEVVPKGIIAFEVGAGAATEVETLLIAAKIAGLPDALVRANDLGGHTRCVAVGQRNMADARILLERDTKRGSL